MTDYTATAAETAAPVPATKLEPDAIGVAQDTVIGMASSAPAVSVGFTIALLVTATAYGSGPVVLLTVIPMLIIANAYRRLNLWNANCGASFEWVGRAINPYLGFLVGWLMIAAYIIATVSGPQVLGPYFLAIFGSNSTSAWSNIAIGTVVIVVMLVIAIVGIRITARSQVGMAFIEYAILVGLAIAGLVFVLSRHAGSVHFTSAWLSPTGIGGKGDLVAGFLISVFIFTGWDGTLYVNEEVKHRRVNPGRAAMIAVALLAIIDVLSIVGLQGVLSPAKLANAEANGVPLFAIAQAIGGGFWAKAMALSLTLSVIATTGTGIVLTARIIYGMASYRVLPEFLSNVSRRFATPVAASLIVGILLVALNAVYFLATSVQGAFTDVIAVAGLLFTVFYIMTALATVTYYRRRLGNFKDLITVGILPVAAAGFLGWIFVRSVALAPWTQRWSLIGVLAAGILLMLFARFGLRSQFFKIRLESEPRQS
jgi:amino acid transporter